MIALAKILKPHGLHGAVVVELLTSRPERIQEAGTVRLGWHDGEDSGKEFRVRRVTAIGRRVIVELEGLAGIDAAEAARGMLFLIPDAAAACLPPGEYYQHDIVGCAVTGETGTDLGTVTDVLEMPAQDVYVVAQGDRTWWLPAAKALIQSIDVAAKRITVRTMDGLLDTGPSR
jgi:16S rRNA processing protein RimM